MANLLKLREIISPISLSSLVTSWVDGTILEPVASIYFSNIILQEIEVDKQLFASELRKSGIRVLS